MIITTRSFKNPFRIHQNPFGILNKGADQNTFEKNIIWNELIKKMAILLEEGSTPGLLNTLDGSTHFLYGKRKVELFWGVSGAVVEIGPGPGANLRYLKEVTSLTAIEPNKYMHNRLSKKAHRFGLNIEVKNNGAEKMDIESNSVDVVLKHPNTLHHCRRNSGFNGNQEDFKTRGEVSFYRACRGQKRFGALEHSTTCS